MLGVGDTFISSSVGTVEVCDEMQEVVVGLWFETGEGWRGVAVVGFEFFDYAFGGHGHIFGGQRRQSKEGPSANIDEAHRIELKVRASGAPVGSGWKPSRGRNVDSR
jgi:hypothetical protein